VTPGAAIGRAGGVRFYAPLLARPRLAALAGAGCLAFTAILYRLSGTSPTTATVFRCAYALPVLLALARCA
jgi:hypothetical protein